MSLVDFLVWLTAGGSVVAVAYLAERWPWFVQNVKPELKKPIMAIAAVVFGCAARAVIVYVPADVLAQLAPWFELIYGTLALYVANQVAHKADPGRNALDLLNRTEPPQ